jgi:chlorite dismutase
MNTPSDSLNAPVGAAENRPAAILPHEGLHVVHQFLSIDHAAWKALPEEQKEAGRNALRAVVAEIEALPRTQLLPFSVVNPRADLGFMLLTPDLQAADHYSKRLKTSLGAGILEYETGYFSLTERSEYTTSEEDYAKTLQTEESLQAGSPEFEEKMTAFRYRIAKYLKYRVEPDMPNAAEWPVLCFYPMSKRRDPGQNWYASDFAERKRLMEGHARVGRTYSGRVLQLITGSTGLDDMEWGVTLLAKTTSEIKSIVYEMRFDEVSAQYAEFGEFLIGIRMDMDSLCRRIGL